MENDGKNSRNQNSGRCLQQIMVNMTQWKMTSLSTGPCFPGLCENLLEGSIMRHNETYCLVGGLEHFLFSHIFEIIIPIDFHIFQRGRYTSTTKQGICREITGDMPSANVRYFRRVPSGSD